MCTNMSKTFYKLATQVKVQGQISRIKVLTSFHKNGWDTLTADVSNSTATHIIQSIISKNFQICNKTHTVKSQV